MKDIYVFSKDNILIGWMLSWRVYLISIILGIPLYILYLVIFSASYQYVRGTALLVLQIFLGCLANGLAYTMVLNKLNKIKHSMNWIDWRRIQYKHVFKTITYKYGWMLYWRQLALFSIFVLIPIYLISYISNRNILISIILLVYMVFASLIINGLVFLWVRNKIHGEPVNIKTENKTIIYLLSFIFLLFILNFFSFRIYWMPASSMEPSLNIGDRFVSNNVIYKFRSPQRFEIVVFRQVAPEGMPKRDLIKRIMGLPGEKLQIKDGVVYINDEVIKETHPMNQDFTDFGPVQIPEDSYFVLGDNRPASADSRYWGFLPKKNITGKAWFKFYTRFKML